MITLQICSDHALRSSCRTYLRLLYVSWRSDPFYCISDLRDSILKRPNIAGDIVKEVDGRHSEMSGNRSHPLGRY